MGLIPNKVKRTPQRVQINQPSDGDGNVIQLTPSKTAEEITNISSLSNVTAQSVSLQDDTSMLEITCVTSGSDGVFLKYATGATSSDFDEFILAGSTRQYIVPKSVDTVSVIGSSSGLNVVIIEK